MDELTVVVEAGRVVCDDIVRGYGLLRRSLTYPGSEHRADGPKCRPRSLTRLMGCKRPYHRFTSSEISSADHSQNVNYSRPVTSSISQVLRPQYLCDGTEPTQSQDFTMLMTLLRARPTELPSQYLAPNVLLHDLTWSSCT